MEWLAEKENIGCSYLWVFPSGLPGGDFIVKKVIGGFRLPSLILSMALVIGLTQVPGRVFAKDLPLLLELSEVGEAYDGKRITVFGWVRSAEVKRGRRGSIHLEIVVGEGDHSIFVYTVRPVPNIINREVIVQGVYHESGRFAGLSAEHYIVAEAIVRDWPE